MLTNELAAHGLGYLSPEKGPAPSVYPAKTLNRAKPFCTSRDATLFGAVNKKSRKELFK
jgi:hypothetical protein